MLSNLQLGIFSPITNQRVQSGVEFQTNIVIDGALSAAAYFSDPDVSVQLNSENVTDNGGDLYFNQVIWCLKPVYPSIIDASISPTAEFAGEGDSTITFDTELNRYVSGLNSQYAYTIFNNRPAIDIGATEDFTVDVMVKPYDTNSGNGGFLAYSISASSHIFKMSRNNGFFELKIPNKTIILPPPATADVWKALSVSRHNNVLYIHCDGVLVHTDSTADAQFAFTGGKWLVGAYAVFFGEGWGSSLTAHLDRVRVTRGRARWNGSNHSNNFDPYPLYQAALVPGHFLLSGTINYTGNHALELAVYAYSDLNGEFQMNVRRYALMTEPATTVDGAQSFIYDAGNPVFWLSTADGSQETLSTSDYSVWGTPVPIVRDLVSGQAFAATGGYFPHAHAQTVLGDKIALMFGARNVAGQRSAAYFDPQEVFINLDLVAGVQVKNRQFDRRRIAGSPGEFTVVISGYYSGYDDAYFPEVFASNNTIDMTISTAQLPTDLTSIETIHIYGVRGQPLQVDFINNQNLTINIGTINTPNAPFVIALRYGATKLNARVNDVDFERVANVAPSNFAATWIGTVTGNGVGGLFEIIGWDSAIDDIAFKQAYNYAHNKWVENKPIVFGPLSVNHGLVGAPFESSVVLTGGDDSTTLAVNSSFTDLLISKETEIAVPANSVEYTLRADLPKYETQANLLLTANKAALIQRPSRAILRLSMDITEQDQEVFDSGLLEIPLQTPTGRGPKLCIGDSPFPGTAALVFDQNFTNSQLKTQPSPHLNIMGGDFTIQFWVKVNHRHDPVATSVKIFRLEPANSGSDKRHFTFIATQPFHYDAVYNPFVGTNNDYSVFVSPNQGLDRHAAEWDFIRIACKDGTMKFTVNGRQLVSRAVVTGLDIPSCVLVLGDTTMDGQLLIKDVEIYPTALSTTTHDVPKFPIFNPDWVACDDYWPDNFLLLSGDYTSNNLPVDESIAAQPILKLGTVTSVASCSLDDGKPYWYFNGLGAALYIEPFQRFLSYDQPIEPIDVLGRYVANRYVTLEMEFVPIYDSGVATYNGFGGQDACIIQFGRKLTERAGLYMHYNNSDNTYSLILKCVSAAYGINTSYEMKVAINKPAKIRIRFCDGYATFHVDGKSDYSAYPEGSSVIDAVYPLPFEGTQTNSWTPLICIGAQLIASDNVIKTTLPIDDTSCIKGYIRNLRLTNGVRHAGVQTLLPVNLPKQGVNQLGTYRGYEVAFYESFDNYATNTSDDYPRHLKPQTRQYVNVDSGVQPAIQTPEVKIFGGDWSVTMAIRPNRPSYIGDGAVYANSVLFEFSKKDEALTGVNDHGWGVVLMEPMADQPGNWIGKLGLYYFKANGGRTQENVTLYGSQLGGGYQAIPVRFLSDEYVSRSFNVALDAANDDGEMWFDLTVSCVNNQIFFMLDGRRLSVGNGYAYDLDQEVIDNGTSPLLTMLQANDFNQLDIGNTKTINPVGAFLSGTLSDGINGLKSMRMGVQDFTLTRGVYRYSEYSPETVKRNLTQRPYGAVKSFAKNYVVDVSRVKTTIGELTIGEARRNTTLVTALELDGAVSATITGGAGSGWTISPPSDGSNYWPISGQVPGAQANFGLKVELQLGFYNYDPYFESVAVQLPMSANVTPLSPKTELLNEAQAVADLICTVNTGIPADPTPVKWLTSHQLDDSFKIYGKPTLAVTAAVKEPMYVSFYETAAGTFDRQYSAFNHQDHEIDFDVALPMQTGAVLYFASVFINPAAPDTSKDFKIYLNHPSYGNRLVVMCNAFSTTEPFLLGPDIRGAGVKHIRYRNYRQSHELFVDAAAVDRVYFDGRFGVFSTNWQGESFLFGSPDEDAFGTYHTANFRWCGRAARDNHYAIKPTAAFYDRWYAPDPYYDSVVLSLPLASASPIGLTQAQYADESKYDVTVSPNSNLLDNTTPLFEGPTVKFLAANEDPIEIHTAPDSFNFASGFNNSVFSIEFYLGNVQRGVVGEERVVLACVGYPLDDLTSPSNWWVTVKTLAASLELRFYIAYYSTTDPVVSREQTTMDAMTHYAFVQRGQDVVLETNGSGNNVGSYGGLLNYRSDNYILIGGSRAVPGSYFEGNVGMVRITRDVNRPATNEPTKHFEHVRPGGRVNANVDGYEITFSDLVSPNASIGKNAFVTDKSAWRHRVYPVAGWRDYNNLYLGQYGLRAPGTSYRNNGHSSIQLDAIMAPAFFNDMSSSNFMIEALVRLDSDQAGSPYLWYSSEAYILAYNPAYGCLTVHCGNFDLTLPYGETAPFLLGTSICDDQIHRITLQRNGTEFTLWIDGEVADTRDIQIEFKSSGDDARESWGGVGFISGLDNHLQTDQDTCVSATWYLARHWKYCAPYSTNSLPPITEIINPATGLQDIHTVLYPNPKFWSAQFILGFDGVPGTSRVHDFTQKTRPTVYGTPIIKATLPSVVNTSPDRLSSPMANTGLTSPAGLSMLEFNGLTDSIRINDPATTDTQLVVQTNVDFTFEFVINMYASQGVLFSTDTGMVVQDGMLFHQESTFAPVNLFVGQSLYRKLVKWMFKRTAGDLTVYANGDVVTTFTTDSIMDFNGLRFGSDQAGLNCAYFALDSVALYNEYGDADGQESQMIIGKYCQDLV